jgi:acetyltransferase, GNAT family
MNFTEYRQLPQPEAAQAYLRQIEWRAGRHLAELLAQHRFQTAYGQNAALYFALEHGRILGFGAITERDYLPRPALAPWIAFIYVDPAARGQHLSARIVRHLESQLARQGHTRVYLVSQHLGFYEKYGYTLLETATDGIHDTDYLYGKDLRENG